MDGAKSQKDALAKVAMDLRTTWEQEVSDMKGGKDSTAVTKSDIQAKLSTAKKEVSKEKMVGAYKRAAEILATKSAKRKCAYGPGGDVKNGGACRKDRCPSGSSR